MLWSNEAHTPKKAVGALTVPGAIARIHVLKPNAGNVAASQLCVITAVH
jgi:hypothetical protein